MPPGLAAIALAPLLLIQGRYVRHVTPRLPEPTGARHGTVGAGEPLRLPRSPLMLRWSPLSSGRDTLGTGTQVC